MDNVWQPEITGKNPRSRRIVDTITILLILLFVVLGLLVLAYLISIILKYVTGGFKKSEDAVNDCLKEKSTCVIAANAKSKWNGRFINYQKNYSYPVKTVLCLLMLTIVILILKGRRLKTDRLRRTKYIALLFLATVTFIAAFSENSIEQYVDYRLDIAVCSEKEDTCKEELNQVQAHLDSSREKNNFINLYTLYISIFVVTITIAKGIYEGLEYTDDATRSPARK